MLDYAVGNRVHTIDTANAYGEAEGIVGEWLKSNPYIRKEISLISKLKPNLLDNVSPGEYYPIMKENLEQSLSRLNTDYLDGYLLHSARYVFNDAVIEALVSLKKQGYAKSIGVSVYEAEEAFRGIDCGSLDFIQLPYSIFDQRMLHDGVFRLALKNNFTIHSRSAFIQGLIFMEDHEVPEFLFKARPVIKEIDLFCKESGISRPEATIGYVKSQPVISHLVFGVDNIEQLKQNIKAFNKDLPADLIREAASKFENLDADIVMPSLWKK